MTCNAAGRLFFIHLSYCLLLRQHGICTKQRATDHAVWLPFMKMPVRSRPMTVLPELGKFVKGYLCAVAELGHTV